MAGMRWGAVSCLLVGLVAACAPSSAGEAGASPDVREGSFERVLDLTGEVRAARGESLGVPQTPAWQLPIRWLIEDGASVAAGDRVAELDNGRFAGDLLMKRTDAEQAEAALRKARADAASKLEQAAFDRDAARGRVAEARLRAEVPADLLSARDYDDRQLALRKAEAEAGKAEAALERAAAEVRESLGAAELALARKRRELRAIEDDLEKLVLRAPRAGLALVGEHPWEGRKLQIGDSLFPGWPVIQIPDLDSLDVTALLFDVDDGEIRAGAAARCIADAAPAEPFACRVRDVSAVARELPGSSTRRAFRVLLDLEDRARVRERLRPGMSMRVEVVSERREHARLARRAALVPAEDGLRLRRPDGGLDPVRLGPCNATDCVLEPEAGP